MSKLFIWIPPSSRIETWEHCASTWWRPKTWFESGCSYWAGGWWGKVNSEHGASELLLENSSRCWLWALWIISSCFVTSSSRLNIEVSIANFFHILILDIPSHSCSLECRIRSTFLFKSSASFTSTREGLGNVAFNFGLTTRGACLRDWFVLGLSNLRKTWTTWTTHTNDVVVVVLRETWILPISVV